MRFALVWQGGFDHWGLTRRWVNWSWRATATATTAAKANAGILILCCAQMTRARGGTDNAVREKVAKFGSSNWPDCSEEPTFHYTSCFQMVTLLGSGDIQ